MRKGWILPAIAALTFATSAHAGAPLKGVDVKLGKNPGGSAAARTTDAAGHADFGVWPKGAYTIALGPIPAATPVHVTITGGQGGVQERDIAANDTARAAPVALSVDGSAPIVVVIETARVKSHSNINNN